MLASSWHIKKEDIASAIFLELNGACVRLFDDSL